MDGERKEGADSQVSLASNQAQEQFRGWCIYFLHYLKAAPGNFPDLARACVRVCVWEREKVTTHSQAEIREWGEGEGEKAIA